MADAQRDELASLVERCATGDTTALHGLYDATAARLKGLAMRITGSADLAEDVVHDVFVAVWRDASGFDSGDVAAWLTMLTRFRALDASRHDGRETTVASPPALADSDLTDGRDVRLHGCLGELDPDARSALVAAFLDGQSYRAIAQHRQMPLDALRSLMRRSLRDLQSCVGQ